MTSNILFEYTIDQAIADGVLLEATEIDLPKQPKFPLGRLIITANADERLTLVDVNASLARHAAGDWGEFPAGDIRQNNEALKHGGRLLSAYRSGSLTFWIITEADLSATTVLMPEDY